MGARSSKNKIQNNRSDGHLLEYFRSTFVRGGGANSAPSVVPFSASGGTTITPGNGYRYHFFTSPGDFITSGDVEGSIDYFVVAGGGGGGHGQSPWGGGGGGAGGVRQGIAYPFPNDATIPVIVGNGGAGGASSPDPGDDGGHSQVGDPGTPVFVYATGGGGGEYSGGGRPGGSGGGGPAGFTVSSPDGISPGDQGFDGAKPGRDNQNGAIGGGGGAGGVGYGPGPLMTATHGGLGVTAWSNDPGIPTDYGAPGPSPGRWFAGGGAGGGGVPDIVTGYGGQGDPSNPGGPFAGGGNETPLGNANGGANTGGGGGGSPPVGGSGNGGSGIVIIRYLV